MGGRAGGGASGGMGRGSRTILSETVLGSKRTLSKKNGVYTFKSANTTRKTKNWDQAMFYWKHYA